MISDGMEIEVAIEEVMSRLGTGEMLDRLALTEKVYERILELMAERGLGSKETARVAFQEIAIGVTQEIVRAVVEQVLFRRKERAERADGAGDHL